MVGLIIGVHAGTVMEGTVREGIIRLMGTRGVVAVATGPKNKMKEKKSKHQHKQLPTSCGAVFKGDNFSYSHHIPALIVSQQQKEDRNCTILESCNVVQLFNEWTPYPFSSADLCN